MAHLVDGNDGPYDEDGVQSWWTPQNYQNEFFGQSGEAPLMDIEGI